MTVKEAPAGTKFLVGYAEFIYTRQNHALDESATLAAVSVEKSMLAYFQIQGDVRIEVIE